MLKLNAREHDSRKLRPRLVIRIRKAAEILEISDRTVRTWISTGIIRTYRVNGLVFIDREELFEDIKRHGSRPHEDSFGEEAIESEPGD